MRHGVEGDRYSRGFQGQLLDDDIKGDGNSNNYKYRMNDPRLGRFFALDLLSSKYPWNSPYAFSENRVIDAIELEGLEEYLVIQWVDASGRVTGTTWTNIHEITYLQYKTFKEKTTGAIHGALYFTMLDPGSLKAKGDIFLSFMSLDNSLDYEKHVANRERKFVNEGLIETEKMLFESAEWKNAVLKKQVEGIKAGISFEYKKTKDATELSYCYNLSDWTLPMSLNETFGEASANLGSYSDNLVELGEIMKALPNMTIKLKGYTNSNGPEADNKTLSESRCISVRNYLINQGVKPENITYEGYGETDLIYIKDQNGKDTLVEDKEKSRRISLEVINNGIIQVSPIIIK